MRRVLLALSGLLLFTAPASAADPLAEARRLYNAGHYDAAGQAARDAMAVDATADAARLVLGRVELERFRQTAAADDLVAARVALRTVDPRQLKFTERLELAMGQAEVLYLDDRFGAAAELFEATLDRSIVLGASAHERVLDWWATALDRSAQLRPMEERAPVYARIVERMRAELAIDSGSTPASYWLAAAARGAGDLERAWQAATAGWVRGALAHDGGAALRADLDRLMLQAIIPERVAKLKPPDARQAATGMQNEWDSFKAGWSK